MTALLYRTLCPLLVFSVTFLAPAWAHGGEVECGSLKNHFGPYDYRTAPADTRQLVERVHFTPKVESLRGGENWMDPSQDLSYTLGVFPNHHRALMALIKWAQKAKTNRPGNMKMSVECRFDRAERFTPDDAMVKALNGVYMLQKGLNQDAAKKLEEALELAGDNANIHYNLGLAYFDLKDYDKSLVSAHQAYKMGFPFPGLRNKLMKVGKWKDPPVTRPEQSQLQGADSTSGNEKPE